MQCHVRLICVVTGLVVCAGCNRNGPAHSVVVRDSAGIKIVETSDPHRFRSEFTISDQPLFSVGQMEGEPQYLLSRVVGAMALPDGSTVIANGGTNELRFYDSTGKWQKSEGREGGGPGEYEYLRAL